MEHPENFESRERVIDQLVSNLEKQEGMEPDFILWDIIRYSPVEGNDAANPEYLQEIAEKVGISIDEMNIYALQKAREYPECFE